MPSLDALITHQSLRSVRRLAWGANGESIAMPVHGRIPSRASTDHLSKDLSHPWPPVYRLPQRGGGVAVSAQLKQGRHPPVGHLGHAVIGIGCADLEHLRWALAREQDGDRQGTHTLVIVGVEGQQFLVDRQGFFKPPLPFIAQPQATETPQERAILQPPPFEAVARPEGRGKTRRPNVTASSRRALAWSSRPISARGAVATGPERRRTPPVCGPLPTARRRYRTAR